MIWLTKSANSQPNGAKHLPRRPSDSLLVRLLAGLLLIRLGASAMRWAVRRVLTNRN